VVIERPSKAARTVIFIGLALSACTGSIGETGGSPAGGSTGSNSTSAGPGSSSGSTSGSTGAGGSTGSGDPNAAGPMPLRRLTNREYNDTVRDLLGDTTKPADQFPTDRDKTFAFRRAGDLAVQDATLLRTAAETLATAAVGKLSTLLPCNPANGEDACAGQFITKFGLRAFRRPLTTAESTRLTALYTTGRMTLKLAFPDAIGLVIEGVLQSPQFLYHWEAAPTDASIQEAGVIRLGSYQIASRLSYFVWGSMPDDALFASAASGELDTVAGVETAARRLLADGKAKETVSSFFADWLELDGLKDRAKDAKLYPEYGAALQQAMLDETSAFVEGVAFGGDGRLGTLLGAPFSYINQSLGTIYGTAASGTVLQRADLNPAQRAGLLTHASFLALTGSGEGSNPVRRGHAVYTKLLCHELPPPPANVPPAKPASAGGTTRQRFVEHDTNACAKACHAEMDPIGFAFENYDGIGKFRTTDNGQPVDATGSLSLDGAAQNFNDAVGLIALLTKSAEVRRCFSGEWFRFAVLRPNEAEDLASLDAVAGKFGPDAATLQDLMVAIATARSFRYREPSPGEMP
jgi:hypothetical protein